MVARITSIYECVNPTNVRQLLLLVAAKRPVRRHVDPTECYIRTNIVNQ